ncbi:hypothetical protein B0I32_108112 [Nonomuraea fuscirosea]|uniref:Uncharacterized protein n=1 Tax=Nonomuraea fuscirosea TaxID=1291556 RepID=A0A2T0MZG7_9ACTN|nr:hypothetical protein [Nonomuraea fuscirosea]PRX64751.1 hypothetical protein B0I32_108112 [Nonomuraea fuscirosea]
MSGLLVGAIFGAVFILVNAQSPLSAPVALVLRVAACLAAAGVIAMWFMTARKERSAVRGEGAAGQQEGPAGQEERPGNMFGRGYLIVVAAEVVLLFGGLRVMAALGAPAQANVGWVALVVGVHFIALAPVWKDWGIAVPGVVLTLLGAAGLVLAATGSALAWVPIISGVLSGVVLLGGSLTFGWRNVRASAL